MKTQADLDAAIARTPGEKVTKDYMERRITGATYHRLTGTLTVCVIALDNGFTVTGESACVDPANYRQDIGEKIAYDNAFEKLWLLFGFALAERRHAAQASA